MPEGDTAPRSRTLRGPIGENPYAQTSLPFVLFKCEGCKTPLEVFTRNGKLVEVDAGSGKLHDCGHVRDLSLPNKRHRHGSKSKII